MNEGGAAGLRVSRRSRRTGHMVSVYDGELAGLDTAAGRWQVVCEQHGSILATSTMRLARGHMTSPDWCGDCRSEQGGV